ncbi:MAG: AraC family transcriptional regulator [Kiritimatiellae bacterium]|jgi:AraC-like DNA-binding protein|nr:AraC family transcriptional regulator [Kiritimatiellia bacterium]
MTSAISNLNFEYMNTSERRVLNLENVGLPAIPMLGYCNYRHSRPDVPLHHHPGCIEIHLGIRNTLSFSIENRGWRLAPGDLFFTQPDEYHTVSKHPKGLIMYWLILRVDLLGKTLLASQQGEAMALSQALTNITHHHFRSNHRIKGHFQSLHMLYDDPTSQLRTLRLRTVMLSLLLEIISAANQHALSPAENNLTAIMNEIESAPEKEHSIDQLARRVCMAPNHFITRFHELNGLPPRQYMLACRIKKAQYLLITSQKTVTLIAMELGFCSSQHFATLFKQHTGVTPIGFRKTNGRTNKEGDISSDNQSR